MVFAFCSLCQEKYFALFSPVRAGRYPPRNSRPLASSLTPPCGLYSKDSLRGVGALAEVGILIIDDDIVSQRALKHVLDSEGWRVRIVPMASLALGELASGEWNLVIVNVALIDLRGPLYAILKELVQAEFDAPMPEEMTSDGAPEGVLAVSQKRLRTLFLVPALAAKEVQSVLDRDGLPYSPKPYHLHD